MEDPRRSIAQRLALSCYWNLSTTPMSPLYAAAGREWLTRVYPLEHEEHKLAGLLSFTLATPRAAGACADTLWPDTLFESDWKPHFETCPVYQDSATLEALIEWASVAVWARFLHRHANFANPLVLGKAEPGDSESLRQTVMARDLPFDVSQRTRHLVTMSVIPLGAYTRYRETSPSLGEKSIAASDIVIKYKVDLSQIPMVPMHNWAQMTVTTQQIWLACALARAWSVAVGDDAFGAGALVFPSELGMPGVARRCWPGKCASTGRSKLPVIVHLGQDHWVVVDARNKRSLRTRGISEAYATWHLCVATRYEGTTTDGRQVPTLSKLLHG